MASKFWQPRHERCNLGDRERNRFDIAMIDAGFTHDEIKKFGDPAPRADPQYVPPLRVPTLGGHAGSRLFGSGFVSEIPPSEYDERYERGEQKIPWWVQLAAGGAILALSAATVAVGATAFRGEDNRPAAVALSPQDAERVRTAKVAALADPLALRGLGACASRLTTMATEVTNEQSEYPDVAVAYPSAPQYAAAAALATRNDVPCTAASIHPFYVEYVGGDPVYVTPGNLLTFSLSPNYASPGS
ncbi:MAG TPA: hypothetical protein VLH84_00710 [Patescibacteria group bacterium]|nr:hypothetical protein [Patescibacteria group bacterium]